MVKSGPSRNFFFNFQLCVRSTYFMLKSNLLVVKTNQTLVFILKVQYSIYFEKSFSRCEYNPFFFCVHFAHTTRSVFLKSRLLDKKQYSTKFVFKNRLLVKKTNQTLVLFLHTQLCNDSMEGGWG